jgi:hypothetical protein
MMFLKNMNKKNLKKKLNKKAIVKQLLKIILNNQKIKKYKIDKIWYNLLKINCLLTYNKDHLKEVHIYKIIQNKGIIILY